MKRETFEHIAEREAEIDVHCKECRMTNCERKGGYKSPCTEYTQFWRGYLTAASTNTLFWREGNRAPFPGKPVLIKYTDGGTDVYAVKTFKRDVTESWKDRHCIYLSGLRLSLIKCWVYIEDLLPENWNDV